MHEPSRGKAKYCIDCQRHTETWRCDACDKMLDRDQFNKDVLNNAKKYKRKAVCLACAARGFSPRDVGTYPCVECGGKGHLQFARKMLEHYKDPGRGTELVCTECCKKSDAIETKLKDKKAIRCTCRGQQHSYSNEKCKLHPQTAGENRWPGSNLEGDKAVTEEDYKFCERMRRRTRQKTSPQ